MAFCGTLHSKGKRMEVSRNEDYYLCLGRSFAWAATATSTSIANANMNRIRFDRMPFPRHRIRAKTKIEIHKSGQWNVLDESLHSQPPMPIAHCPLSNAQWWWSFGIRRLASFRNSIRMPMASRSLLFLLFLCVPCSVFGCLIGFHWTHFTLLF